MKRTGRIAIAVSLSVLVMTSLPAHEVYMMNSNHTDYNWNAPAAVYEAAMLQELDFYLAQIALTAGAPPGEQARYVPDNWFWLHLYEANRTPAQFQQLIDAINSGHITVPLNPFVTLYGALSTEAVIRGGYYPGRMERQHGIEFKLAEAIENHTSPWGLSSIWAGSGVQYTWKGVCGCWPKAANRTDDELFFWEGPDGKTLLFKWYNSLGDNQDWGGYSEARNNLASPSQIDDEITRTNSRQPGISVTGLFGAGWDDVLWESTAVVDAVAAYNATGTGDQAIVSNGIDFFQELEASGQTTSLNFLRGGWGNDWDMWPASLAERTSRARRAVERLRTAEMLAVYAQLFDPSFWAPVHTDIENGLLSLWKYFDHVFTVLPGAGPSLEQMQSDKLGWVQDMENAVSGTIAAAEASIAPRFTTPDEDRVVVFNPLGFSRTDFAQFEVAGPGLYVVTDVATALEVPSQLYILDGTTYLRFLASDVPSLGHRVYRWAPGTPAPLPAAGTVTPGTRTIENALYRVVLGSQGELVDATHLATATQMAGSNGLNDYRSGTVSTVTAENLGPVSVTLRIDLTGPSRTVRVTLYEGIDRIDVENTITQNVSGTNTYSFHTGLEGAQIRFEEIAAVARPGLEAQGGDFLQGTRANRMTLNHFADFELGGFNLVLSNWDSYAMQVNDSTEGGGSSFDLTGDTVHVIVTDWQQGAGTTDQAGDDFFLSRFALRGIPAAFDGAAAMRTALGHQNPLHVLELSRNQTGPIAEATGSLLSTDASNVVVTAFKPAEDPGAGFVVRAWELGGSSSIFDIDASAMGADAAWRTSLIETDTAPASITDGVFQASAGANEIVTYRFTGGSPFIDTDEDGFTPADGDCDDSDPNTFPGAPELCDGNDNGCIGMIPLDEQDQDEDWYVVCTGWMDDQGDDPEILGGEDCDDFDATAFPGAPELCDGVDNDCSGTADDGLVDLDCDDDNACTADSCDSSADCVNTPVVDGTVCDDGDACTTVDSCTSGVCGGTTPPDCDDGNVCTDDSCDSVLGCVNANNAASCDDDDACTTVDTCSGGVCTGGAPPDCDDSNACTADSCDSVLGCVNAPVVDGTTCDDGDACTTVDTCTSGVCGGTTPPDCDDGNACTADSCDSVLGCVNAPVTDGTTCDDGNACTTVDTCTSGVCGGTTPPDCDDGNVCTDDSCDSLLGCVNANNTASCDDGDACTTADACSGGLCTGGAPPNCDDGNVCTDDSCDSLLGCVNANNTASCDDDDACTTADTCGGGVCTGGAPPDCDDGNVCTADSCDSVLGCVNAPVTDGTTCDDGDACTTVDACDSGVCGGTTPPDCDDGNVCTDDSCDSVTGCVNTNNTASCDDGDACTTADTCGGGVCTGGAPPNCDDGNVCTDDSCDSITGCVNTNNTASCDDDDACTTADTCSGGVCTGGVPPDCDDGNACTADSCDSVLGCVNSAVVDGTTCDDGDACTTVDSCTSGLCGGTTPPDCDDGNVCTADSCDSVLGCVNAPVTDGTTCDDGDACTTVDSCTSGLCGGTTPPDCDDGNVCTADSCDSVLGCVNAPVTDGTTCDDGDACTTVDSCTSGLCGGTTPPDCDDGNVCTDDSCDSVLGCVNTNNTASCDDGDACTTGDTCGGGVCTGGAPPNCDDGNVCTGDSCDSVTGCVNANNTASCDDEDACTTADTCSGGVCTGGAPPDCDDGNACTADSCDSLLGCVNSLVVDGTTCDDGDACTTVDTCTSGVCGGTTPPDCDDGNVCTDDSCDSITGCVNTNNNASCDDGDACTTGDTCGGGVCTGGAPPNCDDGNVCTGDSCDSVTGCVNANNTASCDDEDACTTADTCSGGVCTGGAPPDCDDGNACTADSCDSLLGCVNSLVVDGTTCDDGDACTTVDTCTSGVCGGTTPPDCDDGNVCTDDSCDSITGCVSTNNAASCDDGDACTTADTCSGGVCTGGAPPNCDDGNVCTDDSCDSVTGCVNANNTAACDDGDACTTADTCSGGVCTGGAPPDCDDGNACTADSCDSVLGCVNSAVVDGTTCDDGDACTTVDTCTSGVCGGTTPPDCDDGNVCTDDSCDSITGCVSTNNTGSCDDGDACTTADTCSGGVCTGGAPPNCDDGNVCTDDSCDSVTGCVNANNTASCDDDDACTTADACSGGVCTGGAPPDCDDGNACTADSCDSVLGCVNSAVVDGTTCDDGDACTTVDTCTSGVCGGTTPPDCDDGNVCTDDSCDSITGCVSTNNNASCDDGDACTTADTCSGGVCTGGAPPNCDDGNVCTDDSCDSVTGCVNANNTASCDDDDACTTADACSGGVCTGGAPPDCDDGNACTADSCDSVLGCVNSAVVDGTTCDDGDACTTVDTCTSGVCGGTTPPDCDDGNVCTDDSCDSITGCVSTNNTGSCDDGDACTTADTCGGGACTGGAPPNCDDGNVCTDDSCDSITGCVNTNNTASCDDDDACTTADTCSGGVCTGGAPPDCDDGNACTADSCDSLLGCVNSLVVDGTTCDDGDACTTVDTCTSGVCGGTTPPNCDDGNVCTDDSCDSVTGCVNTNNNASCDDGDACTTADTCGGGACTGGAPPNCDDGNVCTDDSCDSITGCVNTNNTASCDDDDACTTADTCSGGVCTGGVPPDCDDGNACTADSCDSVLGCVNSAVVDGTTCDDGDACTTVDSCTSGLCGGTTPPDCDDGNVCTADSCDSVLGCVNAPVTDGTTCDDGDACTTVDSCTSGLCGGTTPPDCDDGNVCTDDSCDSVLGCVNTNNTASCDDGDACTTGDTCGGGVCTGGAPPNCDDGNVCTGDSCDSVTGCVNANNTASCDDEDACTTADTCSGGVCTGGAPPDCDDGNACTADSCDSLLGCVNSLVVDGTTCDDGDACTTVDTCTSGVCGGTTPPDCDDGNVCTDDSCDSITGCVNTNNTGSCDDGDACTTADTCSGGVCTGGAPPNCDDGNVCTDDSCDSVTGCVNANNTASCDDEDACTTADTCSGGVCTGGAPPDCDDGNACTADSCDSLLGCVNSLVVDGTTCDDGDACTTVDTCTSGVCGGTTPPDCDDGNVCTDDSCDSVTGCVNTNNNASCDDGDACTTADTCGGGACTGGAPPNCDDGNVCTDDSCDSITGCVNTNNTASCDDDDACTTADTCSGGVCTGGAPPDCDDGNACTADTCDSVLGCVNAPMVDGTTCDDGDACTTVDTCTSGVCGGTTPPDCDDGNACTADSCDSLLGCVNTPVVDGTTCDDGDACTTVDTCTSGVCGGTTPPDCDDGNVCTDDSCDSVLGCVNTNNTASCDDGDACTTADTCSGGVCTGGAPPNCNDGNVCTDDSCDSLLGCVNANNTASCDDDDACTTADTCSGGVCTGGSPPDCDDDNVCTADSCDSVLGCVNSPVVDGTTCDDGDVCTTVDTCTSGVCGGTTPPDCNDGNACTDDSCDSITGCVNTNNTASCDDGDACTTADTCGGGVCTGGAPPNCDDGNVCTDDSCDSITGCVNTNNTASCDDDDACTTADICGAGVCTGGAPPDCDDGNACTADSCDSVLGCVNAPVVDGTTCDDGDACTTVDTCASGVCGGTTPPDCDDGNPCTADSCDSVLGCVNTPVVDGTTCDDGNACTTVDTCTSGVCGGTTPPDCDDGNVCTDDSCDSVTGCVNTNNTASCDDGDACTAADTCSGGVCTGGTPPNCDDGNVCTDDSCDSVTGCVNANNTANCDDDDACTTADTCSGGLCTGGAPPDCDDGNACTADSCDSVLGCVNAPVDDGTTCDDGDACTTIDTCTSGVCGGTTPPDCDDGNACTADSCDSLLGCVNSPVVDGTTCDDGDACTTVDTCASGVCGGTTPPDCDDGNVCTDDSCDSVTGCVNTNNTASCDDGDACTTGDSCGGGVCTGGAPPNCDDGNVCTDDSCDSITGCVNANNTASCDDDDACTTADTCSGGVCTGGAPPDCDDGNACTADSCDSALGCVNTSVVDGTTCDDGDACTSVDTCTSGVCGGTAPPDCDDGNACTADGCDSVLGCVNSPVVDGTACDDGDACTTVDTCTSGVCGGTTPPDCDDGNACTDDSCDSLTGCVNTNNSASCDDGDACTTADTCGGGVCTGGTPPNCDDGNVCTDDSCDSVTGCVNTNNTASCDDDDACTTADTCSGGLCTGGAPPDCDDGNACTADSCDSVLGCVNTPVVDGTTCDDGDACTTVDTCTSGICGGTTPPDCDDGNACTADSCDSVLGCVNTPRFAGSNSCDDGDACNGVETCSGGMCIAGTPLTCNDANPCTDDSCDSVNGCVFTPDDTNSCADRDYCNGVETCSDGICLPGTPPDCDDGNSCTDDSCDVLTGCVFTPDDTNLCDDGNPCTIDDSCQSGKCIGIPTDCSDVRNREMNPARTSDLDTLDLLSDGFFLSRTPNHVHFRFSGGFVPVKREHVYRYIPSAAAIETRLDGEAPGLTDLDAVIVLSGA